MPSLAGVLGIDSGDCEDLYLPVRYKEEHDLHASIYFDDYGKQDRNAARELLFETAQKTPSGSLSASVCFLLATCKGFLGAEILINKNLAKMKS